MSIFPLLYVFSTWQQSVLAALVFALLLYPVLALAERTTFYRRIAVERESGEFRSSLIIAQLVLASLIAIFWGLLGEAWHDFAIVAAMAWGFGDTAAALLGHGPAARRLTSAQRRRGLRIQDSHMTRQADHRSPLVSAARL